MADLQWSIPSMVDGLNICQRQILFCAFEMNLVKKFRVSRLACHVSKQSAYKHGEAIQASTIIRMAQDFVGSNNLNLLMPIGQFGTRHEGGEDQAEAKYLYTQLSPITRYLFPKVDDFFLNYVNKDSRSGEPTWYVPIIPIVLVNGSQGDGTGLSTNIPNYNPRDIIANIRCLLNGEPMEAMDPWYKGFKGTIEKSATRDGRVSYTAKGVIEEIDETTLCITELPIGRWTFDYDIFLRSLGIRNEGDKDPFIEDTRHCNDDTNVHKEVFLSKKNLAIATKEGLLKKFKLTTKISTSNMRLFDSNGVIKRYDTPEQILDEFFHIRLPFYEKRKKVLVSSLKSELLELENRVRFIREVGTGEITVFGKRAADLSVELHAKGFTPLPNKTEVTGAPDDYEYLLSMTTGTFAIEKFEELCAERDRMIVKVDEMQKTTPKSLWMEDLDALESELDAQDKRDEKAEEIRKAELRKIMGYTRPPALVVSPRKLRKNTKKALVETETSDSSEMEIEPDDSPEVAKPKGKAAAAKKAPARKLDMLPKSRISNKQQKASTTIVKNENQAYKINSSPKQSQAMKIEVLARKQGKGRAAAKQNNRLFALTKISDDEDKDNGLKLDVLETPSSGKKKGGKKPPPAAEKGSRKPPPR